MSIQTGQKLHVSSPIHNIDHVAQIYLHYSSADSYHSRDLSLSMRLTWSSLMLMASNPTKDWLL